MTLGLCPVVFLCCAVWGFVRF